MAELKTKPTGQSVTEFINAVEDPERRSDCKKVDKLMSEITGTKGKMWGESIVGYGNYHYKYASGREGDWMLTGFSPRKQNLTLYIMTGFSKAGARMKKLGKYKTGSSCLYIKRLDDVDMEILHKMIRDSVDFLKSKQDQ